MPAEQWRIEYWPVSFAPTKTNEGNESFHCPVNGSHDSTMSDWNSDGEIGGRTCQPPGTKKWQNFCANLSTAVWICCGPEKRTAVK